jgi:hypothetical protein
MSTELTNLFRTLADREIFLDVDGEAISVDAPKGALTPDIRLALIRHKRAVMAQLRPNWRRASIRALMLAPTQSLQRQLGQAMENVLSHQGRTDGGNGHADPYMAAFGQILFELLRCGLLEGPIDLTDVAGGQR